ncbi:hypothetical protein [Verminephrobacter aporrectodeae]|uniref:hypothetical protein n=3 Tax=Verminephrobacter aporrectodeae TaxID=1110389 RepID=UPI0039088746
MFATMHVGITPCSISSTCARRTAAACTACCRRWSRAWCTRRTPPSTPRPWPASPGTWWWSWFVFPSATGAADRSRLEQALRAAMHKRCAAGAGSARCPTRALVLSAPPDPDAGEITDKGYINQGAVLLRRAGDVAALYASPAGPGVITA